MYLLRLCKHRLVSAQPLGTVFSWTVIHRSLTQGFATPYTVLLVELIDAPGVRMVGNLVNESSEALHAGMAVEAVFTPSEDGGVQLVCWQPARRKQ
jgi:hypothetical protein